MNRSKTKTINSHRSFTITNRGTSLMEVIIGLLVFTFLTLIFATSVIMAKSSSEVNGQYAQAISLCQHKIDQLRAYGFGRLNYTELNDAGVIDTSPNISPFSFTTVDEVTDYLKNPTSRITITTYASNDQVKMITVSISWRAGAHRTTDSNVTLSAYISNVE
ncbi:MAG: hypothetical protein NT018_11100 [Armatimonadetes bacterium]|nr:hypothetical protein [Armatimonadota bacterium]